MVGGVDKLSVVKLARSQADSVTCQEVRNVRGKFKLIGLDYAAAHVSLWHLYQSAKETKFRSKLDIYYGRMANFKKWSLLDLFKD